MIKVIILLKLLVDLLLIHAGFALAFLIQFQGTLPPVNWFAYLNVTPWITLSAFVVFYIYGLYSGGRSGWNETFSALVCATIIVWLISMALSYMLQEYAFPRSVLLMSLPLQVALLTLWRRSIWSWYRHFLGPLQLIVVGSKSEAMERSQQLSNEDPLMYRIQGLVVEEASEEITGQSIPILGTYDDLGKILAENKANGVLMCSNIDRVKRMFLMNEVFSHNIPLFAIPDVHDIIFSNSKLECFNGFPVFHLTGLNKQPVRAWKRAMDVAFAVLFGVIALPLTGLAAIAIKIDSPRGPVFYRQDRVGQDGRHFEIIKLRTMQPDAEEHSGPVLSRENDPRITRVGSLLRKTRIDELPQLWNVLMGDMSFIGPRPERPVFVNQFCKKIPAYHFRHKVKAGITGMAQVKGKYSTHPEDKLRFDLIYAKTLSPLIDIQIIFHTLKVMLMKDKSA